MTSQGFPIHEDKPETSVFNDNTRKMLLQMNDANLQIIKLIYEQMTNMNTQILSLTEKVYDLGNKIEIMRGHQVSNFQQLDANVISAINHLTDIVTKEKKPSLEPLKPVTTTLSRSSSLTKKK